MFKNNHLAGVLNFRSGGTVPNIDGTPTLAAALAGVERAEAALAAARALARSAAKREGRSVRSLFEDSKFILRASGERWCDQARAEGKHEGALEVGDCLLRAQGLDPEKERAQIRARLEKERPIREAETARWHAKMEAAGFFRAIAEKDYEKAAQIYIELHPEMLQGTKAKAILAAGARARMSGDNERPPPEKGSLASRIVEAGRKRRGEI
jgi:hypothetical protein